MNNQKITAVKEFAVRYWNRILLSADRDKFKSAISPDRDWWHLIIAFFALVLFFAAVSGYLYFGIKLGGAEKNASDSALQSGADEQKIRNAVEAISKIEADFEKLIESKPSVSDPSR